MEVQQEESMFSIRLVPQPDLNTEFTIWPATLNPEQDCIKVDTRQAPLHTVLTGLNVMEIITRFMRITPIRFIQDEEQVWSNPICILGDEPKCIQALVELIQEFPAYVRSTIH